MCWDTVRPLEESPGPFGPENPPLRGRTVSQPMCRNLCDFWGGGGEMRGILSRPLAVMVFSVPTCVCQDFWGKSWWLWSPGWSPYYASVVAHEAAMICLRVLTSFNFMSEEASFSQGAKNKSTQSNFFRHWLGKGRG